MTNQGFSGAQGTNAHALLQPVRSSPSSTMRISHAAAPWKRRRFWAGPQPCALLARVLCASSSSITFAADLAHPTAADLRQYAVHRRVLLPAAGFVSLADDMVKSLLQQRSAAASDGAVVGAVIPAPLAPYDQSSRPRLAAAKVGLP